MERTNNIVTVPNAKISAAIVKNYDKGSDPLIYKLDIYSLGLTLLEIVNQLKIKNKLLSISQIDQIKLYSLNINNIAFDLSFFGKDTLLF